LQKNYDIIFQFALIDAGAANIACQESASLRTTQIPRCCIGRLTDCGQDDAAKPMLAILKRGQLDLMNLPKIREKTENV